jgi:signal transduction histidine kinase
VDGAAVRNGFAAAIGVAVLAAALITNNGFVDHAELVLRVILETAVAIIGTLVSILVYGRFRRSRDPSDLTIACAVALLAWVHTLFGIVPDWISPDSVGNGISERYEVWGTLVVRIMAAGFLIAAARFHPGGGERTPRSWSVDRYRALLASAAAGAAAVILLSAFVPINRSGLLVRFSWPQSMSSLLQFVGAALFLVAFLRLSRRARVDADGFLSWIAVGCLFATFAQVSYGLLPTGEASSLRVGDLFRAAAVCAWAVGAITEIVNYWSSIAGSARLEARKAVALDLHDGLAQELALLSAYTHAREEERHSTEWICELRRTAERALTEARRAITVLSSAESIPFDEDLNRAAQGASDPSVDIRVEVHPLALATDLAHRERIVKIVREAVTNAVRHGHARNINIRLDGTASPTLRVLDDGVGFDTADSADPGRYGVISMREAAESIGGSLEIRSAPGRGTTVEVQWA